MKKKLKGKTKDVGIVDFYQINPVNKKKIISLLSRYNKVITVEENILNGGIGSVIADLIIDNNLKLTDFGEARFNKNTIANT